MGKISDILGSREKVTIDIVGVQVQFGRLDLRLFSKLEDEGISFEGFMGKVQKNPASFGTQVTWEMMTEESKADFDHDISLFREALEIGDIERLIQIITDAAVASMPKSDVKKNQVKAQKPKK